MARLEDVLPALRAGKRLRRKKWSRPPGFSFGTGPWDLDDRDITADDWEVVHDSPKPRLVTREQAEVMAETECLHFTGEACRKLGTTVIALLDVAEEVPSLVQAAERVLKHGDDIPGSAVLYERKEAARKALRAAGMLDEGE